MYKRFFENTVNRLYTLQNTENYENSIFLAGPTYRVKDGENLDKRFTKWNWIFGDYCIKDVDLAMGFADLKHEKYMRLPLWITNRDFFEHLIDSYMNIEDITEDEAILKIKKMKKEEPEKYQNEMNEWFDAVHPY